MTQDRETETQVDAAQINTARVGSLPDQTLLELLERYKQKIEAGRADFEEFNAFILCQHERNRRRKVGNRTGEA